MKTESHSRPLARWTVSSLTESAGDGRRDVETFAVELRVEPGEQGRQRDRAVDGLELRDRLDEQVEVLAAGARRVADRRRQLDVDAAGVDDPADQLEQRLRRMGTERAQLAGEQAKRRRPVSE